MKVRTFGECKIIPKNIPVSTIKNRTFKSGETNEENLLVRDELRGICRYGKGYCFTMSQLEMIVTALKQKLSKIELDTLKIANVTIEGPSKTVTGGQYSNPLIKFGKSARLEMQDALGNAKVIDALCGGIAVYDTSAKTNLTGLHYGEDFGAPVTIIGDSFFIDQKTGAQVPVKIIFYQFLPDSIFNLTQDAEGDATVFDMNGDLLTTMVQLPSATDSKTINHGVFYSIVDGSSEEAAA